MLLGFEVSQSEEDFLIFNKKTFCKVFDHSALFNIWKALTVILLMELNTFCHYILQSNSSYLPPVT